MTLFRQEHCANSAITYRPMRRIVCWHITNRAKL